MTETVIAESTAGIANHRTSASENNNTAISNSSSSRVSEQSKMNSNGELSEKSNSSETNIDLTEDEDDDQFEANANHHPVAEPSTPRQTAHRHTLLAPASAETVNRYKDLVKSRSLYGDIYETDNKRNNDFFGDSPIPVEERPDPKSLKVPLSAPPSTKKKDLFRQKHCTDLPAFAARSDEWMGSPTSSRRKSYTIKPKSGTLPPPPENDNDGKSESSFDGDLASTPKSERPQMKNSRNHLLEPPQTASPTIGGRRAVMHNGAYQKSSASSSRLSMPDSSDPKIQKYKEMMRSKAFSTSDFHGTSEDGGVKAPSILPLSSPVSSANKKSASSSSSSGHKWGAPDPNDEMQARPTDFLGSPSVSKRKSYVIKGTDHASSASSSPPPLPPMASPISVMVPTTAPTVTKRVSMPVLSLSSAMMFDDNDYHDSHSMITPIGSPGTRKGGGRRVSALLQRFESSKQSEG